MSIKLKKIFISSLIVSQILATTSKLSYADSIVLNKEKTQGVNVREINDINSEILGGIEDFSVYEIKDEIGDWYEIEFEGKKGFVGKDWFYKLSQTSLIKPADLKENAEDDSDNLTNKNLLPKTKLTILGFEDDYVKVSYDEAYDDNKAINTNPDLIENSSLLYSLSESTNPRAVKTVTLTDNSTDEAIPEVVTLTNRPETISITEEYEESLAYEGPIEGYVKLDDLALSSKTEEELTETKNFYKAMNEAIEAKKAEEEAARNQVREIQTIEYITTTTYPTVNQEAPSQSTETNTNTVMVPVAGSEVGVELYKFGTQFVGNPYVLGGTSLTNGIDCSGFTMRIYQQIGIGLPHFAQSQQRYGVEIPFGQEQAGDLVFFGTSLNNITHVGMADGHGNMVHASSPRVGIIISPIRNPISIKRIIQ